MSEESRERARPLEPSPLPAAELHARLDAVDRLAVTITHASTLDEIYLAALTAVRQALDVARASILLFDADGVLRYKASHGLSETYRRATEGHSPWAPDSVEAEPLLVPDVEQEESLTTLRPVILAEGIRALAFFPLRQPTGLLGKFMAYADVPYAFTAIDVMLGRLIANQVAFVVERTQAEVTRHRLAAIVDFSDDVIVSKTLDGIITSWNHSAERLFGWTAADAIGKHITLIIPDDRRSEEDEVLNRLRRGERVDHFETVRRRKDGSLVNVSITVSPVRDGFGGIVGASKIARDITERRRIEQEREELLAREQRARADAEAANRAKDDFLITLSHELRTPLNSILGWTKIMSGTPQDSGVVARGMETITRNAQQLASLIEDLLDLSSILGGRLRLNTRSVDLVAVLAAALETVRPAATSKDLTLQTHFDPSGGPVIGDPGRLQQVFANLLSNAVKFTPQHGRVDVRLERKQSRALVTVTDTGIGIRQDLLPVVFDRYRQADTSITRAHGGLGLGLAIVRELVALHGGTVDATSPGEGQGATFAVSLPVAPLRRTGSATLPSLGGDLARCDGVRTLIVDDELDARELLTVLLERCGASVTAVDSATAALSAVEGYTPDVLVSDIAMPGIDGYELVRRLRALPGWGTIPAIALTAHASADARVQAFRAGFDTYLAKPIDPAELAAAVSRLARRS